MNRYIPWVIAAISLAAAAYFLVLLMDVGVSIDGARTSEKIQGSRAATAMHFVRAKWIGASRNEVLSEARELESNGSLVKSYDDVVEVDEITFKIVNDHVVEVTYF